MTMRFILFVFALGMIAFPALAAKQGDPNTITVIGEDGKAVTIQMDDAEPMLPGTEPPAPERAPAAIPPPAPKPQIEPKPVEPKPYVDEIVAPPRAEPAPVAEPVKEKPAKTKKTKAAKKPKHPAPPRPPVQKEVQRNVAPGSEITERMATSIAMDAAPPSKGFTSMRQSYKGKDVYVVTFKTEDGPFDVLVDVLTGDVLVSGYVENAPDSGPTAPGHLPEDWEPFKPVPVGPPKKN